jgi:hypothetical protein
VNESSLSSTSQEAEEALAIFEEVSEGLTEDQVEQLKQLASDLVYDESRAAQFYNELVEAKMRVLTCSLYTEAIRRTSPSRMLNG